MTAAPESVTTTDDASDASAVPDTTRTSLLRFATAGSVDDGKSTLVGRLLHDTKSILADAYEAVERVSRERGSEEVDLALLTDGLRAEREQGITIDVAYRYFSTPRRTFILADCPGHVQYTRNTVTGASTADALVVLIDARYGVVEQTKRHLAVAALLRVPHVIVAVNKIDLLDYAQGPYRSIAQHVQSHAESLGLPNVITVPVSALNGDNVATRSESTPWYEGPTVLEILETVPSIDQGADEFAAAHRHGVAHPTAADAEAAASGWRFPVQLVLRPQDAAVAEEFREYRGYAGQVAEGTVRVGDEVVVQPSGKRTTVAGIDTATGPLEAAHTGQSVAIRLADEIDIARGDLLSSAEDATSASKKFHAHVAWLTDRPLRVRDRVLVQHGSATVQAMVASIDGILDISLPGGTLDSSIKPGHELLLNDIGVVTLQLAQPLAVEDYGKHRRTGAFCLVDPQDGNTLAAGTARAHVPGTGEDTYVSI
ncbi:GTP-binding protein [Demequina sp. B12]|uniref:sulfate adenylyltransferase subunit 1 n=1 Tax=Demequina sp. B12 TaxID=2992757 RepID=UPI00237A0A01|nr:GTP-binding protein [Demequina sp. B12]MDE0572378.1 GTP-binding protein [Demequina sp. B12]